MSAPLSSRRLLFLEHVASGTPLGEAYLKAGYKSSPANASTDAGKLLRIPELQAKLKELQAAASANAAMKRHELVAYLCAALRTPVAEIDETHELAQEVTHYYHRDGTLSHVKVKSVGKLEAAKLLIVLLGWSKPEPDPKEAESEAAWTAFLKKAAAEPQPWELEMQRRAERDAAEARAAALNPTAPAPALSPMPPAYPEPPYQPYLQADPTPGYQPQPEYQPRPAGPPPPAYSNEPAPYQECEPPSPWDKNGFNGQVRAVGGFRRPS